LRFLFCFPLFPAVFFHAKYEDSLTVKLSAHRFAVASTSCSNPRDTAFVTRPLDPL
jgi:hypothetical protein